MTTIYGLYFEGRIVATSWKKEDLTPAPYDAEPLEIELPPIIEAIKVYFEKRGLLYAQDPVNALMFLTSEIGELSDAVVHGRGDWVRNHEKEREVGPETADVLMMLCVTADLLGVEPLDEMLKKFAKKGYPIDEPS